MTSVAAPTADSPLSQTVPTPTHRRASIVWGTLFAILSIFGIVVGIETAYHFLGPAIDGPFQLYNALRRIMAGQRGGVDFQFFHGLGIPYLHYIPFRLLGGTFVASEMTREFVSSILYPVTVLIFLKFFLRSWPRTLAWSVAVLAMSFTLRMSSVLVAINSLLGVRSTMPVFLPIALCLPVSRRIRVLISGLVVGSSLILGTEQGLATVAALGIATAVIAFRSRDRGMYIADVASIIAIGIAALVLGLTILGGFTGMREALTYNFKLVPMDQYWYFGSPPNLFLSAWSVVPRMMMSLPRIPLTLLAGAIAVAVCLRMLWRDANAGSSRERFAFAVFTLYGLISCASLLGTYVHAYVQPLLRVLLLLSAVALDRMLPRFDVAHGRRLVLGIGRSGLFVVAATLAMMLVIVPGASETFTKTIPHVLRDHVLGGIGPGYTGIWPETIRSGQAMIDSRRDANGRPPTLWSTYAGLLEARNGMFHPSFDYIIHALGPANRVKYVEDFRRLQPRLVQTVSPAYTPYEGWIEETSWDFYLELLEHYEMAGSTPWSIFWEKAATPASAPTLVWSGAVSKGADSLQLPQVPTSPDGSGLVLLQVEMDYGIRNPLRVLPIVGSLPRYLVSGTDVVQKYPVTIDPYTTTTRFPLIAVRGKAPVLRWRAASLLPGAHLDVRAVRLYVVQTSAKNVVWLRSLIQQQLGTQEP